MNGKSILVVDDEKTVLDCLARDLAIAGLKVTTAVNGEEALVKIKNTVFDLVTTDLVMPVRDGFQVVQEAKKTNPQTMVIVLTGNVSSESAVDAFRLGADDFLQKPCDTDELLCRIANCFAKQEMLRKIALYEKFLPMCSYCEKLQVNGPGAPDLGSGSR
jgi:DNA-binding NtrC family response regulator